MTRRFAVGHGGPLDKLMVLRPWPHRTRRPSGRRGCRERQRPAPGRGVPPGRWDGARRAAYVGRYSRPFSDVVVTQEGTRLMLQMIQKQGLPTPTSSVSPPSPAVPYAFYGPDRLIALDGPAKGARAEIIRKPDGSIGWIRVGSRVARRLGNGVS